MHATRRSFLRSAGFAGGALALAAQAEAWAQLAPAREEFPADLVTAETQAAVDRGPAYLASTVNEDGSFGSGPMSRNVGVVALAGMSFLAGGNVPGRGRFGVACSEALRYILSQSRDNGYIVDVPSTTHGPMYGHGFSTLFLAEVYGMTQDSEVRDKLAKAVELIVESQNDEGGWRYNPRPEDADISVTICQIMALRAARNAGIHVPIETVEKCVDYVKRCQNVDGGFSYTAQDGPSAFPRSAAGVVALYSAGVYEGDEVRKGLSYLKQYQPTAGARPDEMYFYYGHYYAVQAMWTAGGEYWQEWYPPVRDLLLAAQAEDGRWRDDMGAEYGTAMACIILQMPNNYLPIFQR
jgi:hypothetical protein